MHIEPIDPRSKGSAPVVLVYPYGIVVDQDGRRFFDEGRGLVHETWEAFARDIHFARPDSIAYAILDSRLFDIEGYQRAIRSEVPPYQSQSLEDLAAQIGIPARNLQETVDAFNAAATGECRAVRCDALRRTGGGQRPEAAEIELGAPDQRSRLFSRIPWSAGSPILWRSRHQRQGGSAVRAQGPMPGLYAAGETTGHFHGTAPNAVAVLRALVFGRIAGREAVDFVAGSSKRPSGKNSREIQHGF